MRHTEIITPVTVAAYGELPEADRTLVTHAREATLRSYAPYSRFSVGAAILLDTGEIICTQPSCTYRGMHAFL